MHRAARDKLITDHVAWATKIARYRSAKHSANDADEMVGEAMIALVVAAGRWDRDRAPFMSFARKHIEGAIDQRMRDDDPAGRHQRIQEKLGIETDLNRRGLPVRVDGDATDLDGSRNGLRRTSGYPSLTARQEEVVDARMRLDRLRAALATLPARRRYIYGRYYFDDIDLKTIGAEFGITESRISQIMCEVRASLRAIMDED